MRCKHILILAVFSLLVIPTFARDYDVSLLRQKANQGNVEAQFMMGYLHSSGDGVAQNFVEASKWFHAAAEQDYVPAQYLLGLAYYFGKGVPINYQEGVKWVRVAADKGLAQAQYELGNFYSEGKGFPSDRDESIKWYKLAAQQGYIKAQKRLDQLGINYLQQQTVPKKDNEPSTDVLSASAKAMPTSRNEYKSSTPILSEIPAETKPTSARYSTSSEKTKTIPISKSKNDNFFGNLMLLFLLLLSPFFLLGGHHVASVINASISKMPDTNVSSISSTPKGVDSHVASPRLVPASTPPRPPITPSPPVPVTPPRPPITPSPPVPVTPPRLPVFIPSPSPVRSGWHGNDFIIDSKMWHNGSPLTAMGYRVGKNSKLSSSEREQLLIKIFNGNLVFPSDFSSIEKAGWGSPKSRTRFKKISSHIQKQIDLRNTRYECNEAVAKWKSDLAWFKRKYK